MLRSGRDRVVPARRHGRRPILDHDRHAVSQRADLITGGEALVRITVPRGVRRRSLRITARTTATSRRAFATRPDGRFEGLVTGLPLGRSVLEAIAPSGAGARLTITDHSENGPLFSGPAAGAVAVSARRAERDCNRPTTYAYRYASVSHPWKLVPYDPADPPHDVRRIQHR